MDFLNISRKSRAQIQKAEGARWLGHIIHMYAFPNIPKQMGAAAIPVLALSGGLVYAWTKLVFPTGEMEQYKRTFDPNTKVDDDLCIPAVTEPTWTQIYFPFVQTETPPDSITARKHKDDIKLTDKQIHRHISALGVDKENIHKAISLAKRRNSHLEVDDVLKELCNLQGGKIQMQTIAKEIEITDFKSKTSFEGLSGLDVETLLEADIKRYSPNVCERNQKTGNLCTFFVIPWSVYGASRIFNNVLAPFMFRVSVFMLI